LKIDNTTLAGSIVLSIPLPTVKKFWNKIFLGIAQNPTDYLLLCVCSIKKEKIVLLVLGVKGGLPPLHTLYKSKVEYVSTL